MNGWDVFTWVMALVLAGSALVIFAYFLRESKWTFTVGGSSFALWQEYALFLSLPASFLGFLIGNRIGQPHLPTMPPEVSGVIDPLLERAV